MRSACGGGEGVGEDVDRGAKLPHAPRAETVIAAAMAWRSLIARSRMLRGGLEPDVSISIKRTNAGREGKFAI